MQEALPFSIHNLSSPADNPLSRIPHDELEYLQASLRAFAGSLLGRAEWVEDIVQEANLYLLQNEMNYQPGTNFRAWAFSAVRFKVLAWQRDRQRNREESFCEETLEVIANAAATRLELEPAQPRLDALKHCLARISSDDRALLEWKYVERRKLTDLASGRTLTADNLHQKISRLRQALKLCIRKTLDSTTLS